MRLQRNLRLFFAAQQMHLRAAFDPFGRWELLRLRNAPQQKQQRPRQPNDGEQLSVSKDLRLQLRESLLRMSARPFRVQVPRVRFLCGRRGERTVRLNGPRVRLQQHLRIQLSLEQV